MGLIEAMVHFMLQDISHPQVNKRLMYLIYKSIMSVNTKHNNKLKDGEDKLTVNENTKFS